MLKIILLAAIIAVFTALIAYYERKTVQLELQLDSALDELERLAAARHLDHEPPFNLVLDDPALVEAFKLRAVEPVPFTKAEIDDWN